MGEIAIIGAGEMAKAHADALARLGYRVSAVAGRRVESARVLADPFGAEAYADVSALLDRGGLGCVLVCTPTPSHREVVCRVAESGVKAVFCEKPLAPTVEEATAIAETCARHGVALGVGFKMRFEGVFARAREVVSRDMVGGLVSLSFSYFKGLPPKPWYFESGATLEQLIHAVDLANWFVGRLPMAVWCATRRLGSGDHLREDLATLLIRYDGDIWAHINGGWVPSYPSAPSRRSILFNVTGTRGYLAGARPDELVLCTGDRVTDLPISSTDPLEAELRAFLESVSEGAPPPVGARDGIAATAVVEAALMSARTGEPRHVDHG